MANDNAAPTVSSGTLARLFSLTDTRIEQLAKINDPQTGQPVVTRAARGKYDLWASVKGYVHYLQDRAFGKQTAETGDIEREKYRLAKARADQEEIKAALMRGTAHDAEAVAAVCNDMLANFRARCLAIPTKLAPKLEGVDDIAKRKDLIEESIHECLNELADYSPARAVERFISQHREDGEAASETDDQPMGGPTPETE